MANIKTAVDIDIKVDGQTSVQQAATAYEDLGDAVSKTQKEVERLALSQGLNHPETQQAIQDAARYKEQMEKLDFAIQGARGGTETLFRATQGILGGFEAAAGAAALFGVESEDLQKTLVRLQAAMVLSQGLKDFREFLPAIRELAESIRKNLIPAFNTLKGALIATGWGVAAVAVGYLLTNLEKIAKSLGVVKRELALTADEINEYSQESAKAIVDVNKLTDAITNQALSEEVRIEALKKLKQQYPAYFKNIGDDINDTKSLTDAKNKLIDALIKEAKAKAAQAKIEKLVAEELDLQFAAQERYNAALAERSRLVKEGKRDSVAYATAEKELKYAFDELNKTKEANKKTIEELNKIINENSITVGQNAEVVVEATKEETKALKDTGESFDQFVKKLQAFLKYQDAIAFDKMLRTMSQGLDDMSKSAEDTAKSLERLAGVQIEMPKKAEIQMKTYDKVRAYLYQNQEDIDALGGSISGLFGELGENNKAFALAQVATDTARALSGALANSNSPTPDNIATGGIAGIAKYITLATTILGNAKRARDIIRGGQGSTISQSRPSVSSVQAPRTFQASTLGQDFSGQTKVYVTEGDITKTQRRVQNLQRVSVVGG